MTVQRYTRRSGDKRGKESVLPKLSQEEEEGANPDRQEPLFRNFKNDPRPCLSNCMDNLSFQKQEESLHCVDERRAMWAPQLFQKQNRHGRPG